MAPTSTPPSRSDTPGTSTSRSGSNTPSSGTRSDTRNPHRARERALKILFDADLRGDEPVEALERIAGDRQALALLDDLDLEDDQAAGQKVPPLDDFTRSLVIGVGTHRPDLDAVIEKHAHRWTVRRMAVVDRNILRLATYELTHEDTKPAIVIDEALELAKSLSTADSHRFVNGVLEAIRRTLASADTADVRDEVAPDDDAR